MQTMVSLRTVGWLAAVIAATNAAGVSAGDAGPQIDDYLRRQFPALITEVVVGSDQISISGHIDQVDGSLALAEAPLSSPSWPSTDGLLEADPLWVSEPLESSAPFHVVLPRRVGGEDAALRDRLLSKWRIVRRTDAGWELASHARFADVVMPRSNLQPKIPRHKKGLGGFSADRGFVSDLDDLDIACVTVNIPLTFLHSTPDAGRTAHAFSGRTYYVDDAAIARLDQTLRQTAARDIVVLAILLVPPPEQFPDPAIGQRMTHPDYAPPGIYAMPNVSDPAGLAVYAAAIDVLAERYTRADDSPGRIHHWIVHNEVDAGRTWTNAGAKGLAEYVDLYHLSMRTVSLVARQYDEHADVLASLTHSWTRPAEEHGLPAQDVLERLLDFSRAEGDFSWGVAYHPYPQSLLEPATWRDADCPHSLDAPFITFKNIEVLAAWARQPSTWYRGERPRDIHLSEQGFHSADYGDEALQLQAAAMAYAWKKVAALPEIRTFEYHNWIDNRHEGGLRIGLRRFPDDETDPGGKKPIWELYRALGTAEEDRACEFALPLVGVDSWDDVVYRGEIAGATDRDPLTAAEADLQ
jgi:hypothetical protein